MIEFCLTKTGHNCYVTLFAFENENLFLNYEEK